MHGSAPLNAEACLIRAVTIFRALRAQGPAFIATAGPDVLVGALRAHPRPNDWAAFATAARASVSCPPLYPLRMPLAPLCPRVTCHEH